MPELFEDPNTQVADQGALTPGEDVPGIGIAQINDPGVAMGNAPAPAAPSPRDAVQARFATLSPMQKVGAALSEFGAGVQGRPSPMHQQIDTERRDRTLKVAEDREKLQTFVDGMKALQSVPAGPQREEIAAKMAPHMGEMGEAFTALSRRPDDSAKLLEMASNSPTLARSIQTVGVQKTLDMLAHGDFMKTVGAEIDSKRIPIIQQHMRTLLTAAPSLDPSIAEEIHKRGYATHADITRLNELAEEKLPEAAIKPVDMSILNGHLEGAYAGVAGTLGPKAHEEVVKKNLEAKDKKELAGDKYTNIQRTPSGKWVGMNVKTGQMEEIKSTPEAAAASQTSPETRKAAGAMIARGMPISQAVPGYGTQATNERREARDEAISQIRAENPNMTVEQAGAELANRQIDFVAGKRSVTQLNTMLGSTRQAVDQLDFNVKKVTEQMDKLPSSDLSPVINAIARGEQKWTGDPAYGSLFYYMHAAGMESARILQGGQASIAQLHQGAAEEAKKWADANWTTPKVWKEGVSKAMQDEGAYRIKSYEHAISAQRGGTGGGSGAPQTKEAYQQKFGKPPPSIGTKEGFAKLNSGDGYIDSRDGRYKIRE